MNSFAKWAVPGLILVGVGLVALGQKVGETVVVSPALVTNLALPGSALTAVTNTTATSSGTVSVITATLAPSSPDVGPGRVGKVSSTAGISDVAGIGAYANGATYERTTITITVVPTNSAAPATSNTPAVGTAR